MSDFKFASILLMLTITLWSRTGAADRSVVSQQRMASSLRNGLGTTELPVLERGHASTPSDVASKLSMAICGGPCTGATTESHAGEVKVRHGSWTLRVVGDGSSVSFFDSGVAQRAHGHGTSTRMDSAVLEDKARAFIREKLAPVVSLQDGETMEVLGTDFRTESGQDVSGGPIETTVTASRIVFTRIIDGIPVVGNGSKIIITFASDGNLESFRCDWPVYAHHARRQKPAGAATLLKRVQTVVQQRAGVSRSAAAANAVIATSPSTYPVPLTVNAQLDQLECGYYDAGVDVSTPGVAKPGDVRPGCLYHATGQVPASDAGGIVRAGFAGAVPAGEIIEIDPTWPETGILTSASPL